MGLSLEKITPLQVMMLMIVSRLSLTLVYFGMPPGVDQDVWWQSFPAALTSLVPVFILSRIWRRFPEQSLFAVSEQVLGKWLGGLINLLYLLFFALLLSLNIRMVGDFFISAFLPRTPIMIVTGVLILLAVWATRAGIEVIGRAAQVVFPLLVGSILLIILLWGREMKLEYLLPLKLRLTGPLPHLQDMINVSARMVEVVWLGLLAPSVNQPEGLMRAVVKAHLWLGAVWVLMNITIIGVLGRTIDPYFFPFYDVVREIQVADFLERIDSLFLAVWLFGMFLRVSALLWSLSVGAAQWVRARDYRPLVLPLGGIALTYSILLAATFNDVQGALKPEVFTPFGLLFSTLFPLLLLLLAAFRRLGVKAEA